MSERQELWLAALLHDCGKPRCTRDEDGVWRAPGHARAGAVEARGLLWRAGVEPTARERVCGYIRWHMTPHHFFDRPDPSRLAVECALTVRPDRLALLVAADARGRLAEDKDELLERVQLFELFCDELDCLHAPYPFASAAARVAYFRKEGRELGYAAYDDSRSELTMLVGLPGAGKDHWCEEHADGRPLISLDVMRASGKVRRGDHRAHGRMLKEARSQLRAYLRDGRGCLWNATNLSRTQRAPLLRLAADYRARVHIICVECPLPRLREQNRQRKGQLPESAISHLLGCWEAPTLAEAHQLEVVGWN